MVTPPAIASLGSRLAAAVGRDLSGFVDALRPGVRVRPGLYHYRVRPPGNVVGWSPEQPTEWDGRETAHNRETVHNAVGGLRRLHLRVNVDGSGLLMVDAADVIHLNRTAVIATKRALDGRTQAETVQAMRHRFRHVAAHRSSPRRRRPLTRPTWR